MNTLGPTSVLKNVADAHASLCRFGLKIPESGISLQMASSALLEFTTLAPSLTVLQIEILCAIVCVFDHTIEIQPQGPQTLLGDQLLRLDDIIKQQETQAIILTNLTSEIKDSIDMSTENLDRIVEKVNTTIQDTSAQSEPSRPTYAATTKINIPRIHAGVLAKSEAANQLVIIKSSSPSTQELSEKELIAKANMVISLLKDSGTETPDDILFLSARKLRSGAISFELDSAESANWLKGYSRRQEFLSNFDVNAFFIDKTYHLVAEFVPISLTTTEILTL
ncbi:hypothetical protein PAXRUDRAFT_18080 [Paxillus rubicundulus Ve08.2h10]|uniref:Uncharacterized protein n=1 Tax=Paxillus rubicundulus Ve08.2h10 TaxID=930991 RepID=A0A0D0CZA5_9AGAM|nr:hypothetical protein PAXRUDRAFT_18080 [Paxillus rubicundulus Ve08.2h10]